MEVSEMLGGRPNLSADLHGRFGRFDLIKHDDDAGKARTEKPGAAFERLAAAVQSKLDPRVTWNERIEGRQIDATVRGRLCSADVLIIIECRDYAGKLGQGHVDGLNTVRGLAKANKAILVAAHGFTKPALEEAAALGIDTCVLRPSHADDHLQTRFREVAISVRLIGTNIEALEVELVDGRRFPCGQFYQVEDADGNTAFLDEVIKGWLRSDGRNHPNRAPLHLELTPPPKLLRDDEQPLVARLHCVPDTGPADYAVESIWQAPAEWIFVQHTPDGPVDEPVFFLFPELQELADKLKADASEATKQRKRKPASNRRRAG